MRYFKSEVLISSNSVELLSSGPAGLQSCMLWELLFLVLNPWDERSGTGLRILTFVGEPLYSAACGFPTQGWEGMGFNYIAGPSLLLVFLWFLLCVFSCRGSFLASSCFCHYWLFCSCDFGVLLKGDKLRVLLPCHLGCSPFYGTLNYICRMLKWPTNTSAVSRVTPMESLQNTAEDKA